MHIQRRSKAMVSRPNDETSLVRVEGGYLPLLAHIMVILSQLAVRHRVQSGIESSPRYEVGMANEPEKFDVLGQAVSSIGRTALLRLIYLSSSSEYPGKPFDISYVLRDASKHAMPRPTAKARIRRNDSFALINNHKPI